jgi:hypothetical protein
MDDSTESVTLQLAVYSKSVPLGAKLMTTLFFLGLGHRTVTVLVLV